MKEQKENEKYNCNITFFFFCISFINGKEIHKASLLQVFACLKVHPYSPKLKVYVRQKLIYEIFPVKSFKTFWLIFFYILNKI